MELSSQAINGIEFDQVRKGYDPEQVKSFLSRVGAAVDEMRSHLVASDARARAAMARVQELSAREPAAVGSADTDVISKTLLMAQRTADAAVADAQKSADATLADADTRSKTMIADSEARSTEMIRQAELMATSHMESELRTLKERKASLSTEVDENELLPSSNRCSACFARQRVSVRFRIARPRRFRRRFWAISTTLTPTTVTMTIPSPAPNND
jgi:DivIVA domain-containing protein